MSRSLSWLWLLTALILVASPLTGAVAAVDEEEPAAAEAPAEEPSADEAPIKPLFGGPKLGSAGEDSADDEVPAEDLVAESEATDEAEAETEEAGVAEIGEIETTSFAAPIDEEDAEAEVAESDEESEGDEEGSAPVEETAEETAAEVKKATRAIREEAEPAATKPAPTVEKEVETATFNGIRPGESTMDDVHRIWGKPSQSFEDQGIVHQIFSVEPFKEIDVSYHGKTVAAIVIFMEQVFAAPALAEQLGLDNLQAVIIPDNQGNWLGQSYPERGVMFGFDPEHAKEKQVAQIVLEPISGLPFLLRAEVRVQKDCAKALSDLNYALELDPKLARAHALRAQILLTMMRWKDASAAIDAAIALDDKNLEYRLTKTDLLRQTGDFAGAVAEARHVIAAAEGKPLARSAALVELARAVAEGPDRDFRRAADYALEAIKLTDELTKSQQPRSRRAARVVALDAHLELANAIAWGFWRQKDKTVPKWLDRAQSLADKLATEDKAGEEYRLRVASKALAASVGLKGALDPAPWVKALQEAGGKQLAGVADPVRHRQLEWQVGLALYDAMQAYHQLEAHRQATEVGTLAASAIEHVCEEREPLAGDAYLLGRLYFRLGTLCVAQDEAHDKAVVWFDKARPLMEKPLPEASRADVGRQGETLVSMAVSYWSVGQQDMAVTLTENGAALMKKGIEEGVLDDHALQVPYNNLATMHRFLGDDSAADKFTELAEKSTGKTLK
jgi:tetratricopeptide (TPR) repeat protein